MGTNITKPSAEYSDEEYDKIQNTNLKSTFQSCQLAYSLLKAAQNPCIVMIGSVAGGPASIKSGSVYGMTKGKLPSQIARLVSQAPSLHSVPAVHDHLGCLHSQHHVHHVLHQGTNKA